MSADVNIEYFKEILNNPVFVNEYGFGYTENIFIDDYFYIQAVTDLPGRVLFFSITTRKEDFNPVLPLGFHLYGRDPIEITLGKSKFEDLNSLGTPNKIMSYLGAHDLFYGEEYSFGNASNYQIYIFSLNKSGYPVTGIDQKDDFSPPPVDDPLKEVDLNKDKVKNFRNKSIINTYTVTAPFVGTEKLFCDCNNFMPYGPDYNQIRILK